MARENGNFEDHYKVNEEKVRTAQGALRQFLERQRKRAEDICRKERELAAVKIQSKYRQYRHSKDQQELSGLEVGIDNKMIVEESEKPSLELVRRFVDELKEREQDVQEQIGMFYQRN